MHRRISTTLNTLRQDLAAKFESDFIHHACRQAGHWWCDSCLLTAAAIIHCSEKLDNGRWGQRVTVAPRVACLAAGVVDEVATELGGEVLP